MIRQIRQFILQHKTTIIIAAAVLLITFILDSSNKQPNNSLTTLHSPTRDINELNNKLVTLQHTIDELSKQLDTRQQHKWIHAPECMYPVLTLMSSSYCLSAYVLYESLVRVAKKEGYTTCLNLVYVDSGLERGYIDVYNWHTTDNPYSDDEYCKRLDDESKNSGVGVHWYSIPELDTPDWSMNTGGYSFNKIQTFGMIMFERFLFLDSDQIMLRHLDRVFHDAMKLNKMIVGVPDQAGGCNHRRSVNGGFLVIEPSVNLYSIVKSMVFEKEMSCLGGRWRLCDQEIIQCMCGFLDGHKVKNTEGNEVMAKEIVLRPDVTCGHLPVYNQIWPAVWWCNDLKYNEPYRAIHYMAFSKPWNMDKDGNRPTDNFSNIFWCIHDAAINAQNQTQREQDLVKCTFTYPDEYPFMVPKIYHI